MARHASNSPHRDAPRRARRAHALRAGLLAAWRAPDAIERGLAPLLGCTEPAAQPASAREALRAVIIAHAALSRLARLQPSRWRATCLYRSVAECLALRALGFPARVVIGVGGPTHDTVAHAWVECEGVRCRSDRGHAELEALVLRTA